RAAAFAAHRSVFPSTTRASAASIATGCRPARHGLLGNTMALDEGEGLVCHSAGAPDFRDRMRRATGRTLHVPTLAERLRWHGETSVSCANVSPGAAYFQDPEGHGWVHHSAGSFGPGLVPVDDPASAGLTKGIAGGLNESRDSREVVVAPNGTAATLYFADPEGDLVTRVARFLSAENWVGELFVGERLAAAGLPVNTPMQIAVSLAGEDRTNPHGIAGYAPIVQDPSDSESKIGFGQHGGLSPNEQRPFLIVEGGGFLPCVRRQPSSLVDIAPKIGRAACRERVGGWG